MYFDLIAILCPLQRKNFSLICSFYCCLVKESQALKVAYQFAIRGLVAYEPVAYKKLSVYQHISYHPESKMERK